MSSGHFFVSRQLLYLNNPKCTVLKPRSVFCHFPFSFSFSMEAFIGGLCHWDRHQLSHSQAVLICLCVSCPAENLSYLGCLALLVRRCHQGTLSDCLLSSMFVPAWAHITTFEVPCDNQGLQSWGGFWLFEWSFIHSLFLIPLPTADTHRDCLLVSSPVLAHGSELPPCMVHSKALCSHVPFLLPVQPLCPVFACAVPPRVGDWAAWCLSSNPYLWFTPPVNAELSTCCFLCVVLLCCFVRVLWNTGMPRQTGGKEWKTSSLKSSQANKHLSSPSLLSPYP